METIKPLNYFVLTHAYDETGNCYIRTKLSKKHIIDLVIGIQFNAEEWVVGDIHISPYFYDDILKRIGFEDEVSKTPIDPQRKPKKIDLYSKREGMCGDKEAISKAKALTNHWGRFLKDFLLYAWKEEKHVF